MNKFGLFLITLFSCGLAATADGCWSLSLGYKCCRYRNTDVYEQDNDGLWGIEDGEWCGISNIQDVYTKYHTKTTTTTSLIPIPTTKTVREAYVIPTPAVCERRTEPYNPCGGLGFPDASPCCVDGFRCEYNTDLLYLCVPISSGTTTKRVASTTTKVIETNKCKDTIPPFYPCGGLLYPDAAPCCQSGYKCEYHSDDLSVCIPINISTTKSVPRTESSSQFKPTAQIPITTTTTTTTTTQKPTGTKPTSTATSTFIGQLEIIPNPEVCTEYALDGLPCLVTDLDERKCCRDGSVCAGVTGRFYVCTPESELDALLRRINGATTTTTTTTTTNAAEPTNSEEKSSCWSLNRNHPYPCCQDPSTPVVYVSSNGDEWGTENDNWCGINDIQRCPRDPTQDYPCCKGCDVKYVDDYEWGVEENNWCYIPFSCGIKTKTTTKKSTTTTSTTTTTTTTTTTNKPTSTGYPAVLPRPEVCNSITEKLKICGGKSYPNASACCEEGYRCEAVNEFIYMCNEDPDYVKPRCGTAFEVCRQPSYPDAPTCCIDGYVCGELKKGFVQCIPEDMATTTTTTTTTTKKSTTTTKKSTTTTTTTTKKTTTTTTTTTTQSPSPTPVIIPREANCETEVAAYNACGGLANPEAHACCVSGYRCEYINDYFYMCSPGQEPQQQQQQQQGWWPWPWNPWQTSEEAQTEEA